MWSWGWDATSGKTQLVQRRVWAREAVCAEWFFGKFRGRFAAVDPDARPTARLIFTQKSVPFEARGSWAQPAGLDRSVDVYRSTGMDMPGWAVKVSGWRRTDHRHALTIAARRADVGDAEKLDMRGQSNWSLTQRFALEQDSLVARYALLALLDIYAGRLGRLRDTAARKGRIRRPVHDAQDLDRYLVADGLDAATVTSDIANLTKNLTALRWDAPEYTQDQSEWPEKYKERKPVEFVPSLREALSERAARLAEDTANTDGNIRASAQLRQAIANTQLQRFVIMLSILALVVAILSWIHR
jgi:hypothetical protein